jgi:dienelactone hydrolase
MTTQPFVLKDGIVAVGQSVGGWDTLTLANQNPGRAHASIDFEGGRGGHFRGKLDNNCQPDNLVTAARELGSTTQLRRMLIAFAAAFIGLCASPVLYAVAQSALAPGSGHGFLIDKHLAAKLDCGACHADRSSHVAPPMATCLGCHGGTYQKLAAMTASDQPNPHASHLGQAPCTSCHHIHIASQTFCNTCHNFEMTTP